MECYPFTRAQENNSVCLPDRCSANHVNVADGTCTPCSDGYRPDSFGQRCIPNVWVNFEAVDQSSNNQKEE